MWLSAKSTLREVDLHWLIFITEDQKLKYSEDFYRFRRSGVPHYLWNSLFKHFSTAPRVVYEDCKASFLKSAIVDKMSLDSTAFQDQGKLTLQNLRSAALQLIQALHHRDSIFCTRELTQPSCALSLVM
ncbi:uncharacterized protein [Macrobrachium rosenbergii]|uniref:uncharacterized protein n=1 Tax=Macrobrachium rosenbergii TaxID=79674 RepID=UPI0034D71BBE